MLVWNVRGNNMCARHCVTREFISQERVCLSCLQETKTDVISASDLMGPNFDYCCLSSHGASSGILVTWCTDKWVASQQMYHRFSVYVSLVHVADESQPWWLMSVYGPVLASDKGVFLVELQELGSRTVAYGSSWATSTWFTRLRTRVMIDWISELCVVFHHTTWCNAALGALLAWAPIHMVDPMNAGIRPWSRLTSPSPWCSGWRPFHAITYHFCRPIAPTMPHFF